MKRIIIGLVIALASTQTASADGIRSPLGISQAEWNASDTYKNFVCPQGTSRGEGVDLNYTTDRSDDYYFVECNPIVVRIEPVRVVTTTPAPTIISTPTPTITTDTSTATISIPTAISVSEPTTASKTETKIDTAIKETITTTTETTTIKTNTNTIISILDEELDLTWDWDKILAWIIAWFDSIWIRL